MFIAVRTACGIENPLTEDQTHMRITLLPNMLKAVKENLKWKESFKIYEIGRSYIKQNDYFPLEEKFICGIIVRPENDKEIFYDALGATQNFLEKFGAKDCQIEKANGKNTPPYGHPSKCAVVKYRGKEIAVVYEIHPQVLKNPKTVCAAFEINFTRLVAAGQTEHSYQPLPRFPGIEIDISVLAEQKTSARQILELIKRADSALITNISLVDIFSGKSLGEDKKSFTFRVLLQSPDRTLTDSEMKQIQEKIFSLLQKAGFVIRGFNKKPYKSLTQNTPSLSRVASIPCLNSCKDGFVATIPTVQVSPLNLLAGTHFTSLNPTCSHKARTKGIS